MTRARRPTATIVITGYRVEYVSWHGLAVRRGGRIGADGGEGALIARDKRVQVMTILSRFPNITIAVVSRVRKVLRGMRALGGVVDVGVGETRKRADQPGERIEYADVTRFTLGNYSEFREFREVAAVGESDQRKQH
jgi:hypothetical protein